MTTGTTIADTAASKAGAVKPKVVPAPTETPPTTPKPKPGVVVPEGFNVGTFRAADEASMAKAGGTLTGTKTATGNESIDAIYTLAKSKYGNVDSIFLYDPELKALLIEAVGDPATAKDDMDATEFARRLELPGQ
jgi:hypothetical protein